MNYENANALLRSANSRERALAHASTRLVEGDWGAACAAFDVVLVDYPRDAFAPPEFALQLLDATSLLWRLHLEGTDIGKRGEIVAENWARRLETERGFYAFNDFHAMMAFVLAHREHESDELISGMEATVRENSGINAMMTRDVGLPICRAMQAFGQEHYDEVVSIIERVRDIAYRFGGSHAQRDVLTLTLIEAAIRSGRHRLAEHYIAERTILRPRGHWRVRLLQRAVPSRANLVDRH